MNSYIKAYGDVVVTYLKTASNTQLSTNTASVPILLCASEKPAPTAITSFHPKYSVKD